jgi:sec-independent protein translocase protein TatA
MSELVIILIIALLIFGPSRLASIGKHLGETIKSLRSAFKEDDDERPDQKKLS